MNDLSAMLAQPARKPASRPRGVLLAVLALTPLLALVSAPGQAQSSSGDQPIVASLNPPPAGLTCDAAAAATSVYFQFANPPFQVSQVSLYLDGKGVPQDAVDEHWPTVTLSKGLHPGSNTVDIVANGASGQHIERRMVVQVGGASSGASGTAQVACDDAVAAQAQAQATAPYAGDPAANQYGTAVDQQAAPAETYDDPAPVVVQDSPPVVYDTQPQVVYSYPAPVYVYTPYPVVAFGPWVPFVPFFSFGFFYSNYHPWCPPPRVVNGGWYGHGGWYGGGWHGNPGWHGGPGWRGGNPGGGAGPYPRPQPYNGGGSGWHGAPQRGGQPQQTFNAGNNRGNNPGNNSGWHGQPAPQNRGYGQGGVQVIRPPTTQYRASYGAPAQQYRAPAPQYRPMPQQNFRPSAPAFHGGNGGGGGWHGAPAGHSGGGGRRR